MDLKIDNGPRETSFEIWDSSMLPVSPLVTTDIVTRVAAIYSKCPDWRRRMLHSGGTNCLANAFEHLQELPIFYSPNHSFYQLPK